MDLFMIPMSCSLAAHISCLEAGITPNLRRVARATKLLEDGAAYGELVPRLTVPAVLLPDGAVLAECSAVLQYIADLAPGAALAPPPGSRDRYYLAEWLNFISTEIHKKLAYMLFSSTTTPELKAWAKVQGTPMLQLLERLLGTSREFAMGDRFTVADAYLWWALFVLPHGGVSLEAYPVIRAYEKRLRERPTVARALAIEGPMFQQDSAADAAIIASARTATSVPA
jgi:glutathione S-transferase